MNIPIILLHCVMSLIQIYIYLFPGVWAYHRKLILKERSIYISKIVSYFLYPFYNMLEISKVTMMDNMNVFWILMVSTFASLLLGSIVCFALTKLLVLDKRTHYSFTFMTSLSAIGSLPLVLGKALCITGAPLDGDPRCSVITGYMVIDSMIFHIVYNFTGYSIVLRDIDIVLPFEDKLHYLWHLFLYKQGKSDITVLDLFERYLGISSEPYIKYLEFISQNKIVHYKGLEFIFFSARANEDQQGDLLSISRSVSIIPHINEYNINNKNKDNEYCLDYSFIDVRANKMVEMENPEHRISSKNIPEAELISNGVDKYYSQIFSTIEADLNPKKKKLYLEEKRIIKHNLGHFPPKFPIVRSLIVKKAIIKEIDEDFNYFQDQVRLLTPDFNQAKYKKKSLIVILGRVYYPSIIGCFLGMLIGLSDMWKILFSLNHYASNFFDALPVLTVLTVPLLYIAAGYVIASSTKVTRDMMISTKHILISLIVRFVIVPGIGLLWIYIWLNYYGGIVKESKAVRFAMFIPFSLPVSANSVVFLNLVNFYIKESAYQIFVHYIISLIFLAGLFLIYFITLGI
jgi:predicted permease